jgi:hypothetical protein
VNSWLVVELTEHPFNGSPSTLETFQVWIGVNGTQDISFTYDPANLPNATGLTQPVVVGVENDDGSGGQTLGTLPTQDLVVTSTAPIPGQSVVMKFDVQGSLRGTGVVESRMTTSVVPGTTIVSSNIQVVPRR